MATKTCFMCKIEKPAEAFSKQSQSSDGLHSYCRECRASARKKWKKHPKTPEQRRKTDRDYRLRHKERRAEARKAHHAAHPERDKARWQVHYAIQMGRLVRPSNCELCGASGRIEASHDDYFKPLEIQWLCVRCHRYKDKNLPTLIGIDES